MKQNNTHIKTQSRRDLWMLLIFYFIVVSILILCTGKAGAQSSVSNRNPDNYKLSSNGFFENKGQITDQNYNANPAVKYLLCSPGFNVQLRQTGFSYDTYTEKVDSGRLSAVNERMTKLKGKKQPIPMVRNYHRVDVELLGCNPNAQLVAEGKSTAYYNYFTAGCPQGGVSYVHSYQQVTYKNIYPNIDLVFNASPSLYNGGQSALPSREGGRQAEYSFVVHPGGNVSDIKLQYKGQNSIALANNMLKVNVTAGDFYESIPNSYLTDTKQPVQVNYTSLGSNIFGFLISNSQLLINKGKGDLVIDPTPNLSWATYYGNLSEGSSGIVLDGSDNVYITGYTNSSSGIATVGAYQTSLLGSQDAFIAKFNPTGSSLLWGTYYGGAGGFGSQGDGIAIDASNNLYITGTTFGALGMSTPGAYQTAYGGGVYDAFVAKFNSTGSSLLWGTYYGGTGQDYGNSIVLDASDNVYITGFTTSTNAISTPGSYQTAYGGGNEDAFIAKFNPTGTALLWGTYYGGSGDDAGNAITLDAGNDVYVAGQTTSTASISTPGAFQTAYGGGTEDAFVAKFNPTGSSLLWGTYYGGSGIDYGYSLALDASANVYLSGSTTSTSGIASPGALVTVFSGTEIAFIAKLAPNGASRIWGTYFDAGDQEDDGSYLMLDASGNIYTAGDTYNNGIFPLGDATAGAWEIANSSGKEVGYIAKINNAGTNLIWGTYFGGAGNNVTEIYAMALDASNNLFITGATISSSDIATPGAYLTTNLGNHEIGYVAKFDNTIVLPITLDYFTCNSVSNTIELNWATATETNNDFFTIERSTDGMNYTTLATIKGAGNSSVTKSYTYTDEEPLNGENYYRLTQTDYDGHSQTFEPTVCNVNATSMQVYPNPSQGLFNIVLPSDIISVSTQIVVNVTNVLGEQVYSTTLTGQSQFNIDLSHFASGMYFLTITTPTRNYVSKIILAH